jgi:peptidoglycan-associated lipoprotein
MKIVTKISLVMVPAMILVLGGCSTDEKKPEEAAPTPTAETRPVEPPPVDTAPATMTEAVPETMDPFTDPDNLLSQRVVYFDFDSSTIPEESQALIMAHAEYLSKNASTTFTLEGHADERGTREYNIALGERRADSVRRMLIVNGVAENQIKIVSYGEERPAQLGHNESAWAANRRAVFAY